MLNKYKKMGLAAAACMLLGISASQAQVTLTFQQVGNDVTATWSGTFSLGGISPSSIYNFYSSQFSSEPSAALMLGGGCLSIGRILENILKPR